MSYTANEMICSAHDLKFAKKSAILLVKYQSSSSQKERKNTPMLKLIDSQYHDVQTTK